MIRSFLKRLPVPAGCVALGLMGLGTLLGNESRVFLLLFGIPSVLIQLSVLMKLCLPGELKKLAGDPVSLSTLSGTCMAMMLTAAPMRSALHLRAAVVLWAAGLVLHLAVLLVFGAKLFRERPGINAVRGSWLLVYVGIAAASISAPVFSAELIGRILLIPAALGAVIILPLVYLAEHAAQVPEKQRPLFCITAAPVSIWLVGYLSSVPQPSGSLVMFLTVASQLLIIPALLRFFRTYRDPFSPSFAAFTFPFVISATALKRSAAFLSLTGRLRILITMEIFSALVFCTFTVWKYWRSLFPAEKAAA